MGSRDDEIIASDYSNAVKLWKQDAATAQWTSVDVYRGDNPISYAEPDAAGNLVIMFEDIGNGDVHGFLYSLSAGRIWYDLGTDYKWLGAAFTSGPNIAVSEHWKWARVFPIFSLS